MKSPKFYSEEYLRNCLKSTIEERIAFVESLRNLRADVKDDRSLLISMKIKPSLLDAFKRKCKLAGIAYQTQIKKLMEEYLLPEK